MIFNCMIAGVGGQGTVLASKLIAAAAMKRGFDVRTTETIGMAQRGGSVVSHIRIAADSSPQGGIFSPLFPLGSAHALIALEPAEAARQLPYLADQGTLIVCDSAVNPCGQSYEASGILEYLKKNVPKTVIVHGRPVKDRYAKMLNVAVLGAAAQSGIFPFDAGTLKEVLPETLHERFLALNIESFEMGRRLYNATIG